MNDQTTTAQKQATSASEAGIAAEERGNLRDTPMATRLVATARVQRIWPRWAGILLGRLILRVCSSGKSECGHESYHLRVFCKCAQTEWRTAGVLENRFWAVLAVCAAAAVLYCFLRA